MGRRWAGGGRAVGGARAQGCIAQWHRSRLSTTFGVWRDQKSKEVVMGSLLAKRTKPSVSEPCLHRLLQLIESARPVRQVVEAVDVCLRALGTA